jgi:hypothetical protein
VVVVVVVVVVEAPRRGRRLSVRPPYLFVSVYR